MSHCRPRRSCRNVQSHLFDRLKPLPQAQFAEVICGPARRAAESGSTFDLAPELVDRLAQDASGGADTLPLLALTLARLYEDYAGQRCDAVTVDRYEAMGGMRRVVQNEIDNLLSPDPAERSEQLDLLHDAFIPWLATVNSDTDQPMRRIARWADLPEHSHALLNAFVGRRLLVKGERDGQVVVEVALESLLSQWDELAELVTGRSNGSARRRRSRTRRSAWEQSDRRDDWLLDGARLAGAETLGARRVSGHAYARLREFLLASRRRVNEKLENEKAEAESHARSLRRRSQVLAALLAVIVVVAAFAVVSQQKAKKEAQRAVAAKLVSQSRAMLGGTRDGGDRRAIQQMVAAEALEPGSDPEALMNTVIDTRQLIGVITVPTNVTNVDVSPDGGQILSSGDDGLIRRWDLKSLEPEGNPLAGQKGKAGAAYVRDGRWIASAASADWTVRVWDANTGATVHVLPGPHDDVTTGEISPDGTIFATGNRDGTIVLRDVGTGKQIGEPIHGHDAWVMAMAFSPDGTRLLTGGRDGAMQLWNVSTHQPAAPPLPSHRGPVVGVEFSPDGRRIASMSYLVGSEGNNASDATQLRVTDSSSGRPIIDGLTESGYGGYSLAFRPDGRRVAIGGSDKKIHVFDADTGAAVGPPLQRTHRRPISLTYSGDGTQIFSAGDHTHPRVVSRTRSNDRNTTTGPRL